MQVVRRCWRFRGGESDSGSWISRDTRDGLGLGLRLRTDKTGAIGESISMRGCWKCSVRRYVEDPTSEVEWYMDVRVVRQAWRSTE
jgi:hypothetical protein